jgi:hypothetical protein
MPSEPARVLKSDACSVNVAENDIEPDRFRGKPLVSELMRVIELVTVLKIERCSVEVEAEPREPDSPCEKPLTSEATRVNELVRVLNSAV